MNQLLIFDYRHSASHKPSFNTQQSFCHYARRPLGTREAFIILGHNSGKYSFVLEHFIVFVTRKGICFQCLPRTYCLSVAQVVFVPLKRATHGLQLTSERCFLNMFITSSFEHSISLTRIMASSTSGRLYFDFLHAIFMLLGKCKTGNRLYN